MTFNDLEGQNHIAYSAIRPNKNMYAKYQVNKTIQRSNKNMINNSNYNSKAKNKVETHNRSNKQSPPSSRYTQLKQELKSYTEDNRTQGTRYPKITRKESSS